MAGVFAIPGALAVLALQAMLRGRKVPRMAAVILTVAIGCLSYNASIQPASPASWQSLLRTAYLFMLPVLGTLWVLCLQVQPRQERFAAWALCIAGTVAVCLHLRQGAFAQDPLESEAILSTSPALK